MTSSPELRFDAEPSDDVSSKTNGRGVLIGAIVVLVLLALVASQVLSSPTAQPGVQRPSTDPILLEQPEVDGWELMAPTVGEPLAGFPPPMVWRSDRVCIGFARLDFGPDDLRPSLARCERLPAAEMDDEEIRSLLSVKSGFDTWHFLEAAGSVDSVSVRLADGSALSGARVHVSDTTLALRLANDINLASLRWTTGSGTFRCEPDPTAWRTSEFCALG